MSKQQPLLRLGLTYGQLGELYKTYGEFPPMSVKGQIVLVLKDAANNTWSMTSELTSASEFHLGAGTKSLSGTLDRLRITTVGGTDTFDAGSINICWE